MYTSTEEATSQEMGKTHGRMPYPFLFKEIAQLFWVRDMLTDVEYKPGNERLVVTHSVNIQTCSPLLPTWIDMENKTQFNPWIYTTK